PNIPNFPGLDQYKGEIFHSNVWDHNVNLENKDVAIVGTGASAIQIIPEIATKVKSLTIFQRTPPWIVPRFDRNYSKFEKWLFRVFPPLQRLYRQFIYWDRELRGYFFVSNPKLDWAERLAKHFLRASIEDAELREKVTPNYRLGCKRVLVSDNYYPALQQPGVTLVNSGISSLTSAGVKSEEGQETTVDAVIMATGFKVFDIMNRFRALGRKQQLLTERWSERVEAYYGIAVSGFPNMFMLLGPNTALGHNSVILMIEAQAKYIRQCLERMRRRRLKSLEVKSEAQLHFNDWVTKRLAKTIWLSGCQSWYLDENGHNSTIWPGYVYQYQWQTKRPKFHHYIEER
ncbi:MAG: NAD(P)/FAD-dependent oxidoreductase, partial [Planctomycetota bacterium]|nr:NAD(P)/FAD-dependent oxidoreductase [Planctomycetota bacterium]